MLGGLLEKQRRRFAAQHQEVKKLNAVGLAKHGRELDSAELAAWTVTLHAVLNLDEVIMRR